MHDQSGPTVRVVVPRSRGLHSSTFQLKLSAINGIGCARK